jgi:hypothetical protein
LRKAKSAALEHSGISGFQEVLLFLRSQSGLRCLRPDARPKPRANWAQQQQEEISSKAYKLFSDGKKPVEVAMELNLREPEVTKLYRGYWRLKRLYRLNLIYKETNGKLRTFLKLYKQLIKQRGMSMEKVANVVHIAANKLPHMESLYNQLKDELDKMQHTRQWLVNDIRAYLKYQY